MSTAIQFDHVSKKFTLHRERARSFQELIVGLGRNHHPRTEEFWALRDVSFTVEQGETVGLIGVNGAGKSTALKLVSRVIEPTSGEIKVHGRVGALLELGAGFHPDLTGRENIYLNGSIIGLSKKQIQHSLDEIIAFAELERFIDIPVKHYSSGMYMRLGFSVAVHTNPEILLVDEVLSVGDATFQRKCLDRIAELRKAGVTILLVSHANDTIQSLCTKVIWFSQGGIQLEGIPVDVVMAYSNYVADESARALSQQQPEIARQMGRWGNQRVSITKVELIDDSGNPGTAFETGQSVEIRLHYWAPEKVETPVFGIGIHHQNGAHISGPNTQLSGLVIPSVEGEGIASYRIPVLNLLEGTYLVSVAIVNQANTEVYDYHDRLYALRVFRGQFNEVHGFVMLNGTWKIFSRD